jgi:hypothetical protein
VSRRRVRLHVRAMHAEGQLSPARGELRGAPVHRRFLPRSALLLLILSSLACTCRRVDPATPPQRQEAGAPLPSASAARIEPPPSSDAAPPGATDARNVSRPSEPSAALDAAPKPAPAIRVAKAIGRAAVDDAGVARDWPKGCKIWSACAPAPTLKPCAPDLQARDARTITQAAPGAPGDIVAVRGPLVLHFAQKDAVGCDHAVQCCHHVSINTFVGEPPNGVFLAPYGCFGDESRRCCTAPAFGQEVVARGKLRELGGRGRGGAFWALTGAELCLPSARP